MLLKREAAATAPKMRRVLWNAVLGVAGEENFYVGDGRRDESRRGRRARSVLVASQRGGAALVR